MSCKEGKCAFCQVYPNSDGLACDTECHFDTEEGERYIEHYKEKHPKEMSVYVDNKNN